MMLDSLGASIAGPAFVAKLLASFALLALILATGGIYAVIACGVAQRTRSGVRMVLGATPHAVLTLVLTQSAFPLLQASQWDSPAPCWRASCSRPSSSGEPGGPRHARRRGRPLVGHLVYRMLDSGSRVTRVDPLPKPSELSIRPTRSNRCALSLHSPSSSSHSFRTN